jgi:hypothetical protein
MACWSGSFPCRVCISIQVAATLSIMSDSLPLQSYHSILVYCCGFEDLDLDMDMVMIILSLGFLYLLTIDIDMGQHFACLCMF